MKQEAQGTEAGELARDGTGLEAVPRCLLCAAAGQPLYQGLADVLFGSPGSWTLVRCANSSCALVWLSPRPRAEHMDRYYARYYTHDAPSARRRSRLQRLYDDMAGLYLQRVFGYPATHAGWLARNVWPLLRLLPVRQSAAEERVLSLPAHPGGRLLEIGCGSGATLQRLVELGWEGMGIDLDAQAVEQARVRGLDVKQGTLEEQRLPDDHFDAVACAHVIEHVADPLRTMTEVRRVLRPGGLFVAYTPNAAALGHAIFRRHWRGLEPPRHLYLFNASNLAQLARLAAFPEPTVRSSIRGAGPILLASWALWRGRSSSPAGPLAALLAEALSFLEWTLDQAGIFRAEELVLIARKPTTMLPARAPRC